EATSFYCNREPANLARLLLLRCKGVFLRGTVNAPWHWMNPRPQLDCLASPEGHATASGVESSHTRSKRAAALMPRKNLLSLFAEFARFGADVAVVQRRGYRREKLTYAELYARVLFWSYALAGRGIVTGDHVLLCGADSADWVTVYWGTIFRGAVVVAMDAVVSWGFVLCVLRIDGVRL